MKICVLGNSHVGSLKNAWDELQRKYPNIEITFFAAPKNDLSGLSIRNQELVPTNKGLEKILHYTSGGKTKVNPKDFDLFLIYGLYFRVLKLDERFSDAVLIQACRDNYLQSLNYQVAAMVRQLSSRQIYIGHHPLKASESTVCSESKSISYNRVLGMTSTIPNISNLYFLPQPEITIENGWNTRIEYSKGSTRLEINVSRKNIEHPNSDLVHMNEKFGEIYLNAFLEKVSTEALISGNFFTCIGAQKAGTRWLHDNLDSHRDVWVPYIKELHYFDGIHIEANRNFLQKLIGNAKRRADSTVSMPDVERLWRKKYGNPAEIGDPWYVSLFEIANGAKAFGEVTPEYSMLPDEGFAHIARIAPQAKIIFIMRDPVGRVWSQIRFRATKKSDKGMLEPKRAIKFADSLPVVNRTTYDKTIERLEHFFPKEQILYLFYEDIARDGLSVLKNVCNFLQIEFDPVYFPKAGKRLNVSISADLPNTVRKHLKTKYAYLIDFVEDKFGRVPAEWRDS
ncbi:hypothetical protein DO97_04305 [Neosynechococcus sphagnicola sy1]|uniref:Sulfotransferase domain-containing protein n=2 Tax=Neosynechococcus TaxID=1501143 RepID=A0A098TQ19_9CYAN|nr:hypothetical protein DO97_04305 [Neosynechococcus sphagnicola sy1]